MKKINTFQELLDSIKPGDKIYIVRNGNLNYWIYACTHPQNYDAIVCISPGSVDDARVISKYDLKHEDSVFVGEYDSKFLGEVMLIQTNARIDSIKKIYIQDKL